MLKKVILSTLMIGLIGVLAAGAIIRTIDRTENVAEARGLDRGRGGGQGAGYAEELGQSRGTSSQSPGRRGYAQAEGTVERQYPNYESAPEEWGVFEGAAAVRALPGRGNADYGRRQGAAAVDPQRLAPVLDDAEGGALSESEVEALLMALDDEYKAWSVYEQVIAGLGEVRPFTSIQKAEENHIAALVTLFDRYGLDVPANDWPGNVPSFDTLAEACQAGVQAEIDNAALYDALFSMVDNPDIIRVFASLQQASLAKHLPAFERCAP